MSTETQNSRPSFVEELFVSVPRSEACLLLKPYYSLFHFLSAVRNTASRGFQWKYNFLRNQTPAYLKKEVHVNKDMQLL